MRGSDRARRDRYAYISYITEPGQKTQNKSKVKQTVIYIEIRKMTVVKGVVCDICKC